MGNSIATQLALPYTVRLTEDRRAVKPDEKEAQRSAVTATLQSGRPV